MANQPRFLYHGTNQPDIKIFIPKTSSGSGEKYGPQVYATDNYARAVIHTLSVPGSWSTSITGNQIYAIFTQSKDTLNNSPPGYIYTLPTTTFTQVYGEYQSSVPVTPLKYEEILNPFQKSTELGVIPIFLSQQDYDKYLSLKNGEEINNFIQSKLQP